MKQSLNAAPRRIVWMDVVRFAAFAMIVGCHCTDPFNFMPDPKPANAADISFWGAFWGSLVRPGVPLFAMITGALLLPVRTDASVFYRKRIPRVLWPFLFWSVVYALFPWLTGVVGCDGRTVLDFFPYSGEEAAQQSLQVSLGYVAQIPLNFHLIAVHMWYIYLLIGLYLYLPVFSAWVEKASMRAKWWFLAAWGVTLLVPYYRAFVDPYIWGSCSWNEFQMLYYFAGFNGYLLLGHVLRRTEWSLRRTLAVGIPVFAAGWAVTFFGFRHITAQPGISDEMLELFFYYGSLNVAAMSFCAFMMLKKLSPTSVLSQRFLSELTTCGFGIYMVHYFFAGPSVNLMRAAGLPLGLQVPCATLVAFGVSMVLVAMIRRLGGWTKYITG